MSNIGVKNDQGKVKLHMCPIEALEGMARAFMYGHDKYAETHGKFNYKNGIAYTRLIDSTLRHLHAFLNKENVDEESGLSHLDCLLANAAMLKYMAVHKGEFDDR